MVYNPTNKRELGGNTAPLYIIYMIKTAEFLLYLKYIIGTLLVLGVILAPAWLARQNGRGKPDMHAVRLASWVFGWSIISWLWSLFWATKK